MLVPYQGTPDAPFPPAPAYFRDVDAHNSFARQRGAGLIGQLPVYHFVDERGPDGIYRFFSYETPFGISVSALRRELEAEPAVFDDGTLGATNADFVAPTAAQVAANPPGDTLASAIVDMLTDFEKNGVPSEHTSNQSVITVQTAWNNDPLSQLNANGELDEDGGYGPNVHDAVASIAGSAPAVNTSGGGSGPPTPLSGQTTSEPVPKADATCTQWVADVSTPQATAIAGTIAFHDSPVAWSDQGIYNTTINGVPYRYVMWWEKGLKAVAAYKCASTPGGGTTPTSQASTSAVPAIVLGTLVVGSLVATGFAARKPLTSMYHRTVHHRTVHARPAHRR